MDDYVYYTVAVIVVLAFIFFAGLALGAEIGSDSIARKWCVSLDYSDGHWAKLMSQPGFLSCENSPPVQIDGK